MIIIPILVGGIPTPVKNMSSSVGMMKIPTEWEKSSCSKPPVCPSLLRASRWEDVTRLGCIRDLPVEMPESGQLPKGNTERKSPHRQWKTYEQCSATGTLATKPRGSSNGGYLWPPKIAEPQCETDTKHREDAIRHTAKPLKIHATQ